MLDNKWVFSKEEYTSIRQEMIQRINNINDQLSTVIVTFLSVCAVGLSLFVENLNDEAMPIDNIIALSFVRAFIFFIPIVYTIPLAIKSGENLRQIVSISAYIRVFHEYISFHAQGAEGKMRWETSNNIFSEINVDRKGGSHQFKLADATYTLLPTLSFVFYSVFSFLSIKTVTQLRGEKATHIFLGVYIAFGLLALVFIVLIRNFSCVERNMMRNTVKYVNGYIEYAKQIGIFTDEDYQNAMMELNPMYTITETSKKIDSSDTRINEVITKAQDAGLSPEEIAEKLGIKM